MKSSYKHKSVRRSPGITYLYAGVAMIFAGIILILCVACMQNQTADQPEIMLHRDVQQLVDTSEQKSETVLSQSATENTQTLSEKYHIPNTYDTSFSALDGWLDVSINADISVPGVNKVPIAEIKSADFSEVTVSLLFERLCGKYEMYRYPDTEWTKATIQQSIDTMKRQLADPEIDPLNKQDIQKRLDAFEKLYASAPDAAATSVPQKTNGELYPRPGKRPDIPIEGHFSQTKDKNISFCVINNEPVPDFAGNVAIGASLTFMTERGLHNFSLNPLVRIKDETRAPKEANGKLKVTPAEVRSGLEALLKDTGMVVADISLYDDRNRQLTDGETSAASNTRYAYRVLCRRAIEGVYCSLNSGTSSTVTPGSPSKMWLYENLEIWYDDQGIFRLEWASPNTVTRIVNKDAKLLSFEEIQSVFQSMSNTLFKNDMQYYSGAQLEISYITLTLERIGDMSELGKGMLVPAWNFYGTYTEKNGPTGDYLSVKQPGSLEGSWMTINAIDGSIIDTKIGK